MTDPRHPAPEGQGTMPLVLLALGSCAVVYAAAFLERDLSALVQVTGGLVFFLAYFLLRRLVQEAADLPNDRLDEREVAARDRSYLEAYRMLGAAVAGSLVLAIVDDAVGDLVVSWNAAWAALLLLALVLPSAVLAHRIRTERAVA